MVMESSENDDFTKRIETFIDSRKGKETQLSATRLILLFNESEITGDGWIRTNEIQCKLLDCFSSQKTLFRFLNELVKQGIIEKEPRIETTPRSHADKEKPNIYYRLKGPKEGNTALNKRLHGRLMKGLVLTAISKFGTDEKLTVEEKGALEDPNFRKQMDSLQKKD